MHGRLAAISACQLLGTDRRCEVKVRANGFIELYDWLDDADLLIVRADRRTPLVVIPWKLAVEIATAADREVQRNSRENGNRAGRNPATQVTEGKIVMSTNANNFPIHMADDGFGDALDADRVI